MLMAGKISQIHILRGPVCISDDTMKAQCSQSVKKQGSNRQFNGLVYI
jgi:hypothetical protein